jgi:hypothetical protein
MLSLIIEGVLRLKGWLWTNYCVKLRSLGLKLAVNIGLSAYLDTRKATNKFVERYYE